MLIVLHYLCDIPGTKYDCIFEFVKVMPHHKREKTEMARARSGNGRQQTAKTSCTLGYKRYKKKAWKTTKELDRHRRIRLEKHRHDL